jgi:phenylpropionate dioxygenase-like ring-hydroxylating dioxygenase large terminal subunit
MVTLHVAFVAMKRTTWCLFETCGTRPGGLPRLVGSCSPARCVGRPIVLYRTQAGLPVALADACWHRLVTLSLGQVRGDGLMCRYHGITYSPQGRCAFMPSRETINPSASVASFPVVDRYRLCWVWLGDPELADPALIPDILAAATDPGWAGDGELLQLKCDYRLVLDNLMDLTHETYVHDASIGQSSVAESPFTVEHTDDTVTVTRWMYGIDPPAVFVPGLKCAFPAMTAALSIGGKSSGWRRRPRSSSTSESRWPAPGRIKVIQPSRARQGHQRQRPRPTSPPTISGCGCVTTHRRTTSSRKSPRDGQQHLRIGQSDARRPADRHRLAPWL